jgi:hypothetical protein
MNGAGLGEASENRKIHSSSQGSRASLYVLCELGPGPRATFLSSMFQVMTQGNDG